MRLLPPELPERFWAKVQKSDGCWIWTGATDRKGYGRVGVGGRKDGTTGAHVWMCTVMHGAKPSTSHMVLHSCDNPSCVNPEHLSWGLAHQNSAQMVARGRSRKATHCLNGHEQTPENTYPYGGCKPCARARARKRRQSSM
jgi:hypothetical protein